MRYLVDTTFLVDFLRGDPGAAGTMDRVMADGDELFVTEVIVAEAWSGGRPAEEARLRRFLALPEFVQPGPETAERAGALRREARAGGSTLSLADALIAAAAEACDATVLTRNTRDFSLTPVAVEAY